MWLHYGASNVHHACAEEAPERSGQLEGSLPRCSICPLLLWYPNQQVGIGPKNPEEEPASKLSGVECLTDEQSNKERTGVVGFVRDAVYPWY